MCVLPCLITPMVIKPSERMSHPDLETVMPGLKNLEPAKQRRLRQIFDGVVAAVADVMGKTAEMDDCATLKAVILYGSLTRGNKMPGDVDFITVLDTSELPPPEEGKSYRSQVTNYERVAKPSRLLEKRIKENTGLEGQTIKDPESLGINFVECNNPEMLEKTLPNALELHLPVGSPPKEGTEHMGRGYRLVVRPEHVIGEPETVEAVTRLLEKK